VGNELADRLARAAASDNDAKIVFNRLPLSALISKVEEETQLKWQNEREECAKAGITKEFFFPTFHDRQKLKIDINPILTAMVTGHGKTRAYLHRFKILDDAKLPLRQRRSIHRPFNTAVLDTAYAKRNTQK
jgi:hypothetical protein